MIIAAVALFLTFAAIVTYVILKKKGISGKSKKYADKKAEAKP